MVSRHSRTDGEAYLPDVSASHEQRSYTMYARDMLFLQDKQASLISVPLPSMMRGALSHQTKMRGAFGLCATSSWHVR